VDGSEIQAATMAAAGDILRRGGVCVYPTETYFGLGAGAFFPDALARVAAIKGRPAHKPLPLLAADLDQVADVVSRSFAASPGYADFMRLAGAFWPGPLSLVVPTREGLSPLVKDARGRTSIRSPRIPWPGRCAWRREARSRPPAPTKAADGRRPGPDSLTGTCAPGRRRGPGAAPAGRGAGLHRGRARGRRPAGGPAPGAVTDEALAGAGFAVTFSSP
jgi:L-threonylcarbamoyladenylate synthase